MTVNKDDNMIVNIILNKKRHRAFDQRF